ncbi:hypothetical protein CRENBAI_005284 [Crenichthys baileyi]|uniref:Exonuclease domain-containing protein n=1 Tax=Crenichthys baileyi TaxID=28760 RepID=A0AAV9SF47_9TELE
MAKDVEQAVSTQDGKTSAASTPEQDIESFVSLKECEAHFVPGYNLGGEGFDIVKMKRKGAYVIDTETWNLGNGTCKMYINSYMNGENQKVPLPSAVTTATKFLPQLEASYLPPVSVACNYSCNQHSPSQVERNTYIWWP